MAAIAAGLQPACELEAIAAVLAMGIELATADAEQLGRFDAGAAVHPQGLQVKGALAAQQAGEGLEPLPWAEGHAETIERE